MSITLIQTVTVGAGGAASIDFTSIPGTYTDLMIMTSARTTGLDGTLGAKFNGSSTGYTRRNLGGNGSSPTSYSGSDSAIGLMTDSTDTASTFGNSMFYVPNYASSANKSYSGDGVQENNGTTSGQVIAGVVWANSAAITSISIIPGLGTIAQYSTASLYGITKGSSSGVIVA
jgi:hypothetical protein